MKSYNINIWLWTQKYIDVEIVTYISDIALNMNIYLKSEAQYYLNMMGMMKICIMNKIRMIIIKMTAITESLIVAKSHVKISVTLHDDNHHPLFPKSRIFIHNERFDSLICDSKCFSNAYV